MSESRPSVYLETTVPSYLTAWPSRDIVMLAHQQITHDFWKTAAERFQLVISQAVMDELRGGDPEAAAARLAAVANLPSLVLTPEVNELHQVYVQLLQLPSRAVTDALHLAYAVAHQIDYIVTWNLRHLANGAVQRRVSQANDERGLHVPVIVTPEALL